MASPEELTPLLPDTLPEDFGEWDGEASQEPLPIKPGEWEAWEATHSFGEPKSPRGESAGRVPSAAPPVERPRASGPAPSAPAIVDKQKHFIDWDGVDSSPTPKPDNLSEWEAWEEAHSFGKSPKTPKSSPDREASLSPVVERPRLSGLPAAAPDPVKPHEFTSKPSNGANGTNGSINRQRPEAGRSAKEVPAASGAAKAAAAAAQIHPAEAAKALQRENDQALFQAFSQKNVEVAEKPKTDKKKWIIIASAGGGAAVLLAVALMSPLLHRGAKPAAQPSVQLAPQSSDTQPETTITNPPDSDPANQAKPSPTSGTQPATAAPLTSGAEAVQPASGLTKKQAKMMNDQLAAPTVIPQGGKQSAENAPPPVSMGSGADGLGGASDVLNGRTQPSVKIVPSRPFDISSGVATGMLVRQTAPVYPNIAKAAGVSGTVVLQATISKTGAIKDVHVMSGSPMLQQAAIEAVKTWRYKPYKLSNEPIEVQTTISVVFSLGK
ncbi:MAG TPA: TonB family protein [Terracidiphilus sp.]|jgi:TonB family protein